MTTLSLKALVAFALIFAATFATVSHMARQAPAPAHPALRTAQAAIPDLTGKPARLRPDQGCVLRCEPPPDPVTVAEIPAPAPPAAPAVTTGATTSPRPATTGSRPPVTIGSTQQALINADRAAAGLPPLAWSSCLAGIAASWASYMARTGVFQHGPGVKQDFGCGLGSSQCGENIAWMTGNPDDARANTMFMNSPEHRANILGPYGYVGTAWATANGKSYIVEEFG